MRRVATSCASRRSVPGNTNRNSRDLDPMSRRSDPILALFFVSGFAGLIYESVWSHYVKLFLGHAAYAQTLVLVVFMGGSRSGRGFAREWRDAWPIRCAFMRSS